MPKIIQSLDEKIASRNEELKALKKKKKELEAKKINASISAILKAMKKNKDFANEFEVLCKKYNVEFFLNK